MITDVLIADSFSIQTLHMTISFNVIKQQSKKKQRLDSIEKILDKILSPQN